MMSESAIRLHQLLGEARQDCSTAREQLLESFRGYLRLLRARDLTLLYAERPIRPISSKNHCSKRT